MSRGTSAYHDRSPRRGWRGAREGLGIAALAAVLALTGCTWASGGPVTVPDGATESTAAASVTVPSDNDLRKSWVLISGTDGSRQIWPRDDLDHPRETTMTIGGTRATGGTACNSWQGRVWSGGDAVRRWDADPQRGIGADGRPGHSADIPRWAQDPDGVSRAGRAIYIWGNSATFVACGTATSAEVQFYEALRRVDTATLRGQELHLTGPGGAELVFEAASSEGATADGRSGDPSATSGAAKVSPGDAAMAQLLDTRWSMGSYSERLDGGITEVVDFSASGPVNVIEIAADGTVSGNMPCGSYSAMLMAGTGPGAITAANAELLQRTECDSDLQIDADWMFALLSEGSTFRVVGDALTISNPDRGLSAEYHRL